MNRQEVIKVLAIMKAAWPNAYRGMTKEEANGTINVWATQFADMPASVVLIAVNKLVSTNTFPPSINEVKEKIRGLYHEAEEMLRAHKYATEGCGWNNEKGDPVKLGTPLDPKTLAAVKDIIRVCEPMRTRINIEPSLSKLLGNMQSYLEAPGSENTEAKKLLDFKNY